MDQDPPVVVYELSMKPQKLKPLSKKKNNLALSLLENDPKPSSIDMPSSANLDKEIKEYLDANKIFKQLKTAF